MDKIRESSCYQSITIRIISEKWLLWSIISGRCRASRHGSGGHQHLDTTETTGVPMKCSSRSDPPMAAACWSRLHHGCAGLHGGALGWHSCWSRRRSQCFCPLWGVADLPILRIWHKAMFPCAFNRVLENSPGVILTFPDFQVIISLSRLQQQNGTANHGLLAMGVIFRAIIHGSPRRPTGVAVASRWVPEPRDVPAASPATTLPDTLETHNLMTRTRRSYLAMGQY